jgi:hypothetical protein
MNASSAHRKNLDAEPADGNGDLACSRFCGKCARAMPRSRNIEESDGRKAATAAATEEPRELLIASTCRRR